MQAHDLPGQATSFGDNLFSADGDELVWSYKSGSALFVWMFEKAWNQAFPTTAPNIPALGEALDGYARVFSAFDFSNGLLIPLLKSGCSNTVPKPDGCWHARSVLQCGTQGR